MIIFKLKCDKCGNKLTVQYPDGHKDYEEARNMVCECGHKMSITHVMQ